MGFFHKITSAIGKVAKTAATVAVAPVAAVAGIAGQSQSGAVASDDTNTQTAVQNDLSDSQADTETNDTTQSQINKTLAKGKSSLTIARSGGSGLNI
ncbi:MULTISPECIES: hypothetical protein [unclassified Tatumella]|uniref:hypothetical protein n=1 Tax=unclassified Tatumella TaxID=2649542 RepID=UPI001BAF51A8|nr:MULTISPECIES: hypothetical protein [unclassified Tatumella]MBS0876527.1 hypothetical protein [Tatumella sp. JGM82]MBS0889700.1 hypothetical protein [Tatumella sp. JGM94]MBS0900822.1 hypothetical protein [Tatumella sp. JGM100]